MKNSIRTNFLLFSLPFIVLSFFLLFQAAVPFIKAEEYISNIENRIDDSLAGKRLLSLLAKQLKYYTDYIAEPTESNWRYVSEARKEGSTAFQSWYVNLKKKGSIELSVPISESYMKMLDAEEGIINLLQDGDLKTASSWVQKTLIQQFNNIDTSIEKLNNFEVDQVDKNALLAGYFIDAHSLFAGEELPRRLQVTVTDFKQVLYFRELFKLLYRLSMNYQQNILLGEVRKVDEEAQIRNQIQENVRVLSAFSAKAWYTDGESLEAEISTLALGFGAITSAGESIKNQIKNDSGRWAYALTEKELSAAHNKVERQLVTIISNLQKRLNKNLGYIKQTIWRMRLTYGFIGLVVLSVLIFGPFLVSRKIIQPILKLTDFARNANLKKHMDERVEVQNKDEIGELARAFNAMLDDISSARKERILREAVASTCSMAEDVEAAMQTCLGLVSEYMDCNVGHIYFYDSGKHQLVTKDIWHIKGRRQYKRLKEMISGLAERSPASLPKRVLKSKKPEATHIMSAKSEVSVEREAVKYDLIGSLSFPVVVGGRVEAIFELFSEKEFFLKNRVSMILTSVGAHLGRVIERSRK